MNTKKYLHAVLIIFLAICFTACQKPLAPEYLGIDNLKIGKLSVQESQISTNLKFYNPNTFNLQLKKAEMDIFVNDKLIDHYILDSTIYIAKKDTFYIPVSVKIDFRNIFSNALLSLLNNEIKIRLAGEVRLKKGSIGFKVPVQYEEKDKLDALLNQ